ncbi:MAG: hypothetical protein KAG82_11335 [Alcanivoracaceae bacterium]|nr:hypothetical protein [Alcanivoracaceae bacterium]
MMATGRLEHLFMLAFALAGCGSDSGSSPKAEDSVDQSVNLTGTWKRFSEQRVTHDGEYLGSDFSEELYVISDDIDRLGYSACRFYTGSFPYNGAKSDGVFYPYPSNPEEPGFQILSENTLLQTSQYRPVSNPGTLITSIDILLKLRDDFAVDSGGLVLSGPIAVTEYDRVCLYEGWSNSEESIFYGLTVPYEDTTLYFRMTFGGDVESGSIYSSDGTGSEMVEIELFSNAIAFEDVAGKNNLAGADSVVKIIERTGERVSGTFEFFDQNGEKYSGEFEFFLH